MQGVPFKAKPAVIDVQNHENQGQKLALLKILSIGAKEIREGRFRDAEEAFADLEATTHDLA